MPKILNRVGEKHITNEGYEIEIIEYFSSINCTIRFKDGHLIFNRKYNHIKKGTIRNVFHPSVYGIGFIGIGDYRADNNSKATLVYRKWSAMLERGYCPKYKSKNSTYKDVTVDEHWHNFQNFAKWFEENFNPEYMDGWHLDKDSLFKENKIYSPETCCFLPSEINSLFTKSMILSKDKIKLRDRRKKYRIRVNINKKIITLSGYDTAEEAFQAYKIAKEAYIKEIADKWRGKITEKVYNKIYNYQI